MMLGEPLHRNNVCFEHITSHPSGAMCCHSQIHTDSLFLYGSPSFLIPGLQHSVTSSISCHCALLHRPQVTEALGSESMDSVVITNISLTCSHDSHDRFETVSLYLSVREWNSKSSWDEQNYET